MKIEIMMTLTAIEPHFEAYLCNFKQDWLSGKYEKFSDCPNYEELYVIIKAMNCLRKYLGWKNITIRDEIEKDKIEYLICDNRKVMGG